MPELGLFTPANPVTNGTPAEAVANAVSGGPLGGGVCAGLVDVTAPPPELPADQVLRASDYAKTGAIKYATHMEAVFCTALFFQKAPPVGAKVAVGSQPPADRFIDTKTGRLLQRTADGTLVESEDRCLQGFGLGEYKTYDLQGELLCSRVTGTGHIDDPKLPPAQPGAGPSSGLGPYGFGDPLQRGQGAHFGVRVAGITPRDVLNFLQGQGVNVDLSGVLSVLAALVLQGGNIRNSLDELPPALTQLLGPQLEGFGLALDRLSPGIGVRLANAIDHATGQQRGTAADSNAHALAAVQEAMPHWVAALVQALGELLKRLLDDYRSAAQAVSSTILNIYRRDLEDFGRIGPDNVDQVAARALSAAITAGTAAQLAGMGIELVHPLKTLGVQQAIGLIAEFAGFGEIAKPFFNATLRYAIGLPAEHRAAAHFRTNLPASILVRQLAAAGHVPPEKYHERLVLEGLPDPYPDAFLEHLYAELTPRALAAFVDGSEADRPWIAEKLRYAGLSPRDTERITKALELKATQPGRTKLIGELLTAHRDGQLEDPDLQAGLAGAGLSATHQTYYLRAAALQRRGKRIAEVAGEVVTQYRGDTIGAETAKQLLRGLGLTEDEVTVRLTVADLKKNELQVRSEERAIEAEIRTLKAEALRAALVQIRAGFLDVARFLAVGQGMGYSRQYLELVLGLARGQGPPKTTARAPAIGAGALEEAREKLAELVARSVQVKQTDRVAALVSLRSIGLPEDLASVIVQLAEAIGGPSPRAGDYGLVAGAKLGGAFGAVAAAVVEGLAGIRSPADLVTELLGRLGLPGLDRAALTRLIQDLRQLFGGG